MTGSASQAMDVVFGLLLGEKIVGRGSRGREGLGIGPRAEAGGLREAKEMIISKRTVGPELQSETWSEATFLARGEGSGEGGKRPGFSPGWSAADYGKRGR